jgi:hypothetical protein
MLAGARRGGGGPAGPAGPADRRSPRHQHGPRRHANPLPGKPPLPLLPLPSTAACSLPAEAHRAMRCLGRPAAAAAHHSLSADLQGPYNPLTYPPAAMAAPTYAPATMAAPTYPPAAMAAPAYAPGAMAAPAYMASASSRATSLDVVPGQLDRAHQVCAPPPPPAWPAQPPHLLVLQQRWSSPASTRLPRPPPLTAPAATPRTAQRALQPVRGRSTGKFPSGQGRRGRVCASPPRSAQARPAPHAHLATAAPARPPAPHPCPACFFRLHTRPRLTLHLSGCRPAGQAQRGCGCERHCGRPGARARGQGTLPGRARSAGGQRVVPGAQ